MLKPRPYDQVGVSGYQRYMYRAAHGLTRYTPVPDKTQLWMCPTCDHIHYKESYFLVQFKCKECEWTGNRNNLLTEC